MLLNIFDFDRTISINHTFNDKRIESYESSTSTSDIYEDGKKHAQKNAKVNIKDWLTHENYKISAIATFHNNPHFIAGYVSHILGKELAFSKISYPLPNSTDVAHAEFFVEGVDTPFIISYIPKTDDAFQLTLANLKDKNTQISALIATLQPSTKNHPVCFYDDSRENYKQAKQLQDLNCFHIHHESPSFDNYNPDNSYFIVNKSYASNTGRTIKIPHDLQTRFNVSLKAIQDMAVQFDSKGYQSEAFHAQQLCKTLNMYLHLLMQDAQDGFGSKTMFQEQSQASINLARDVMQGYEEWQPLLDELPYLIALIVYSINSISKWISGDVLFFKSTKYTNEVDKLAETVTSIMEPK